MVRHRWWGCGPGMLWLNKINCNEWAFAWLGYASLVNGS
jgi:hypothetical protein